MAGTNERPRRAAPVSPRWHGTRVVFLGIRDADALSMRQRERVQCAYGRRDATRHDGRAFRDKDLPAAAGGQVRVKRTRGRCVPRAACQIELNSRKLDCRVDDGESVSPRRLAARLEILT